MSRLYTGLAFNSKISLYIDQRRKDLHDRVYDVCSDSSLRSKKKNISYGKKRNNQLLRFTPTYTNQIQPN